MPHYFFLYSFFPFSSSSSSSLSFFFIHRDHQGLFGIQHGRRRFSFLSTEYNERQGALSGVATLPRLFGRRRLVANRAAHFIGSWVDAEHPHSSVISGAEKEGDSPHLGIFSSGSLERMFSALWHIRISILSRAADMLNQREREREQALISDFTLPCKFNFFYFFGCLSQGARY